MPKRPGEAGLGRPQSSRGAGRVVDHQVRGERHEPLVMLHTMQVVDAPHTGHAVQRRTLLKIDVGGHALHEHADRFAQRRYHTRR